MAADVSLMATGDAAGVKGVVIENNTLKSVSVMTVKGGSVDIKNAAGDGISTTLAYNQSSGNVTSNSVKDGIQAGKAYTYYDIHGSGDDETVLYETNGVVNITGGALTITAGGSAGKAFKVTNSSGNEVLTYIPEKSYSLIFVCSPDISSGNYTLSYGGTVSGGTVTGSASGNYGIVTGGSYSGGSSSSVTAAISASSSGGFGPGR